MRPSLASDGCFYRSDLGSRDERAVVPLNPEAIGVG